jgi:hypothetical protein
MWSAGLLPSILAGKLEQVTADAIRTAFRLCLQTG